MTLLELKEIVDILSKILTPFAILIMGLLLITRIESMKTRVAHTSDLRKKSADHLSDTSQKYIELHERFIAVLYNIIKNPDPSKPTSRLIELENLTVDMFQFGSRIERLARFAPEHGQELVKRKDVLQDALHESVAGAAIDLKEMLEMQIQFSIFARRAQAELLEIDAKL